MTSKTSYIPTSGARVRLDDESIATAYPDRRAGDGTYITVQPNLTTGGMRYDYGWRREQLDVIGEEA